MSQNKKINGLPVADISPAYKMHIHQGPVIEQRGNVNNVVLQIFASVVFIHFK